MILGIFLIAGIVATSGCTDSGTGNYLTPISKFDVVSYKASVHTANLNQLINPDSFTGQKFKVTGTIFQISVNDDGTTDILLNTPQSTSYNDRIYITYGGNTSFVKGDKVAVYGGSYNYESVEGYNIILPWIKAVYIE